MRLPQLLEEARACTLCEPHLPEGARPLLQASSSSRIVIIGQAPGGAAHRSGVPWDDTSGRRLRDWLGVTDEHFYDARRIALVPMGFCYPGKGRSGDLAPRPECAPQWHDPILKHLRRRDLTIYVGRYAVERYLEGRFPTVTDAVRAAPELLPDRIALPHPSPRNNRWLASNPWFERRVLPALRCRVAAIMA